MRALLTLQRKYAGTWYANALTTVLSGPVSSAVPVRESVAVVSLAIAFVLATVVSGRARHATRHIKMSVLLVLVHACVSIAG